MRKNEVRYRVLKAGSFSRGLYFYFKKEMFTRIVDKSLETQCM